MLSTIVGLIDLLEILCVYQNMMANVKGKMKLAMWENLIKIRKSHQSLNVIKKPS